MHNVGDAARRQGGLVGFEEDKADGVHGGASTGGCGGFVARRHGCSLEPMVEPVAARNSVAHAAVEGIARRERERRLRRVV